MKCKRTDMEHKIFDDNKCGVSQDTLLAYLDFIERFIICADARDSHLGSLMSYNSKPIAFYSHKLMRPQTQYTVT